MASEREKIIEMDEKRVHVVGVGGAGVEKSDDGGNLLLYTRT